MQILWENLKEKVATEFHQKHTGRDNTMIGSGGRLSVEVLRAYLSTGNCVRGLDLLKEMVKECEATILRTDIRNFKSLMELCPNSFPKWVKNGQYTPELTDNGWVLIKIDLVD